MNSLPLDTTTDDPAHIHTHDNYRAFVLNNNNHHNEENDEDGENIWQITKEIVSSFFLRLHRTPFLKLCFVGILIFALMGGNATQLIMLNFWLRQYPGGAPGNYTTLAVSGFVFSSFFFLLLLVYIVCRRPDLRFALRKKGWEYLSLAGFLDTIQSALAVYAASHTPPVLQAVFTALVPIYAAYFTRRFLNDEYRNYNTLWIKSSFSLIALGVLIASVGNVYMNTIRHDDNEPIFDAFSLRSSSASSIGDSSDNNNNNNNVRDSSFARSVWSLIFALSVPVTVLLNIVQTLYMMRYTYDPEFLAYVAQRYVSAQDGHNHNNNHNNNNKDDGKEEAKTGVKGTTTEEDNNNNNINGVQEQLHHMTERRREGKSESSIYMSHHYKVLAEQEEHKQLLETHSNTIHTTNRLLPLANNNSNDNNNINENNNNNNTRTPIYGEDTAVKLVMLAGETALQCLFTLLWLPMDALPWYGDSHSVPEAFHNFMNGLHCLFTCPHNLICCCGYSVGFVCVYLSAAYLNQYSVTLCSMVSQLSAPVTALLLILFPVLNVATDDTPWWVSVMAIVLMVIGTFLYVLWESHTEEEKMKGELELKLDMFGFNNNNNNENSAGTIRAHYDVVTVEEEQEEEFP